MAFHQGRRHAGAARLDVGDIEGRASAAEGGGKLCHPSILIIVIVRAVYTGVLRRVDEKNHIMPTNAAAEDYWFYVDPAAMLESQTIETQRSWS